MIDVKNGSLNRQYRCSLRLVHLHDQCFVTPGLMGERSKHRRGADEQPLNPFENSGLDELSRIELVCVDLYPSQSLKRVRAGNTVRYFSTLNGNTVASQSL